MDATIDSAPLIFYSSTDDGIIIEVNQTLCTKLGYEKEELIGQKIDKITTIATRIFQQTHFFPLLKMHGNADEIFITLETKNKDHLPVLINAERKLVNEKWIIIYVGIVVHNRKKFENELVAARKAAETALNENTELLKAKKELQDHSEQLDEQLFLVSKQIAELKQINRVVTHDLQEPLRKMQLFASMIQHNQEAGSNSVALGKITSVLEQMRSVISSLQQYMWLTESTPNTEKIDFNQLLNKLSKEVEETVPGVELSIKSDVVNGLEADPQQMSFIIKEILTNAVRFRSNNEVKVNISANKLMVNKFRSIYGKYKYVEFLKLAISDNGIGFNPLYKEQVFGLFKKLHPQSGLGVGLSLCKKIIENNEGTISIDSEKDKGTTVSILWPLKKVATEE